MALTDKKYSAIHNKTGSDKDKIKDIFDEGHTAHFADNPEDSPIISALMYQIQEMQEELDYLRTEIALNKSKTTFPGLGTSSTTALAGDTKLIALGSGTTYAFSDMIDSRGNFFVRLTLTHRGVTKFVDLALR